MNWRWVNIFLLMGLPTFAEDIYTQHGKIHDATIMSTNSEGISVRSKTGVKFFTYADLSEETRRKHNFPAHGLKQTGAKKNAPEDELQTTNINGRTYFYGPRGGRYYMSKGGRKVYE